MNKPVPFTYKQTEYLQRCKNAWFNVAEGGKRGGKNVLQTMAFCTALDLHKDKVHLIAGVTQAAARLNILDCDGYGLLNYFDKRHRIGQFQGRDCVYVKSVTGEKVVLFSGGGKKGDEKLIKGNTYGMVMVTEANECAKEFLMEAFDRTISSSNRKIFHDLNPKAEMHWYYQDILKFHEGRQKEDNTYGYNYGHFTIADNLSIADDEMRERIKTYDKNSVWYKRDILGQRKQAEGLIYSTFADNYKSYLTHSPSYDYIQVGVDFGGNKSAFAFVASGLTYRFSTLTALASERIPAKGVDPDDLYKHLNNFIDKVRRKYGRVHLIYCDSAEQTLINGIRAHTSLSVRNSLKKPITDRIKATTSLISQERFFYTEDCETLVNALSDAIYDPTKFEDVRLDNGTSDIDTLDAFEYSFERYIKQYMRFKNAQ